MDAGTIGKSQPVAVPAADSGASIMYAGDAEVDQTAQGVRFKGEFDTNLVYFLGGTVRYTF